MNFFQNIVEFLLYVVVCVSIIIWVIDDSTQNGIAVLIPLGVLILQRIERNSAT